ncbi:MAG: type VI secretion system contractile sheath large subunit [Hyphomicrobiales bacterium]|jgi:type VI secretion system protein ImpC|nr:type VI secretion system contractile sheath large subunit [Hyphomicrobiales bacterium]
MATQQEQKSAATTVAPPAPVEAEEFAQVLKGNFKPRTERAATEVENAVQTLVTQALADSSLVKGEVLDTIEEMIARLDEKLSAQMNEVLHAPEFQQLESAWRGLNYLVFNSETDASLKIRVMNVGKMELYRNLKNNYPGARWDQSPLFKAIYESEFGTLGGEPYGAIVADYAFSHNAVDVQLLRDLSKIASASLAPLVTGADPNLLGMDSWRDLMNPRDIGKLMDTPDYAAWKGLRDSVDSRYVALCMPRVLSRMPYGAKTEPVEEFAFEEDTDGNKGEKYGWMNAAYVMGTNINRAFKEYGWTVRIRGVESGGEVLNLPVHTFPTDDGGVDMKCPTEIAITDRREAELSKVGLISIVHRKNTDKAAFIGAQSVYKPKLMDKPEATASENLSARIPYMFAVSRFAHYLKCMVRDKIGSTKEKDQLERWLNNWIVRYVDADPKNSSEQVKAIKPLAGAKVTVIPNEENPGYYSANVWLRPHFQLEGMDIGMSLVASLAERKG